MKLSLASMLKGHDIVKYVWGLKQPPQRKVSRLDKDIYFFVEITDKEDGLAPFSNIIVHYGAFVSTSVSTRYGLQCSTMIYENQFEIFREENIQVAFFEKIKDDDRFQEVARKTLRRWLPGF